MKAQTPALALCALLTLAGRPATAAVVDLKLADVIKGFDKTDTTRIGETSAEISQANLKFVIKGGGSLVLCEGGKLGAAGVGGSCKDNAPAIDGADAATIGSISDILGFVADGKNKFITLYSDPTFRDIKLDPDGLKAQFGPYLAYVEEGHYFDERNGNSGLITDAVNTTVYIRSAKSFDRAFVIGSDTTGREAIPEPSTWLTMVLGFALAGWRLNRRRQAAA